MAFQADPAAALPMIQADFSFAIFKAALNGPTAEGNSQQLFDWHVRWSIAQEVFDLSREWMIADEQVVRSFRQSAFVFDVDQHVLDAPHQGSFLGVLDAPCLPTLSGQGRVRLRQPLDGLRFCGAGHKARSFSPRSAPLVAERPVRDARGLDPSHQALGNLSHKPLTPRAKRPQKRRLAAVPFVKGQPIKPDSLRYRAVIQLQRNLRLRTIDDLIWNSRAAAAFTIVTPALGQKQIAVEQAVKASRRVTQVNGDDAVLLFSHRPAILPLDARRVLALLHPARFVN